MRRSQLVLIAMVSFGATTWVHAQGLSVLRQVASPEPTAVLARVSADEVVARMMSFDRNNDGKVETAELAERMQNLVSRGDVNGDGALDRTEFRTLADAPPAQGRSGGFHGAGSYGFGEQLSSRNHIEGAIEDLRLASATKEPALAIANAYIDTLESSATADLLKALEPLVTAAQLATFKAQITPINRPQTVVFRTEGGETTRIVTSRSPDLGRLIAQYGLAPIQWEEATAAVEQYKTRLRLGEADRSKLLEQMKGILSVEERDDLRAALERRPVVATGIESLFFAKSISIQNDVRPFNAQPVNGVVDMRTVVTVR